MFFNDESSDFELSLNESNDSNWIDSSYGPNDEDDNSSDSNAEDNSDNTNDSDPDNTNDSDPEWWSNTKDSQGWTPSEMENDNKTGR